MDIIALGLGWYAAFVLSVTFHEAAHAWMALRLGDPTAYRGGQVTLDPLPHIQREPLGMVLVPIVSYALGGWMIGWGSAPYNPEWAWDNPRRSAWMALAGPVANFLLLILAALIIRVGLFTGLMAPALGKMLTFSHLVETPNAPWLAGLATFISILFSLNVILCFFNLLPLPPLDGAAIPTLFLKRQHTHRLMETLWNPNYAIFGLIIAWNVFSVIIGPIYGVAQRLLFLGIAG